MKRKTAFTAALTGLLSAIALTVMPASPAHATGALIMSSGTENRAVILEPDIPTDCTAMPFPDVDNVILAVSGKVRISRVELYSDGSCGTRVATLVAGEPSSIGGIGAAVSYRGFLVSG